MKIIFLDIDGVLNSLQWDQSKKLSEDRFRDANRSIFDRTCEEIDPAALMLLKDFVLKHDIKIVISSSWRIITPYKRMIEIFAKICWRNAPVIGETPVINEIGSIRGNEIDLFLATMHEKVEKYAILDDSSDMTIFQKESHFVQTDWSWGLQEIHIRRLKDILL